MEINIDQALQHGIAAHRQGKLSLAERFYRTILQVQPFHADANHNLGVLAISHNKSESALPLLKIAVNENPRKEQFWLSYISALVIEKKHHRAKQAAFDAMEAGVNSKKLKDLSRELQTPLPEDIVEKPEIKQRAPHSRKMFFPNRGKKKVAKKNRKNINPPKKYLDRLIGLYKNGLYVEAEKLALSIVREFPEHQYSWNLAGSLLLKRGAYSSALEVAQQAVECHPENPYIHHNLGLTFQANGMLEPAVSSMGRAIELKPDFSAAHYNFGNIVQMLGRLEQAEQSYARSIALKPDYVHAHYNLGNVQQELGRFHEAEDSYKKAIELEAEFAEGHYGLGCVLEELGKIDEAEERYRAALALKPNFAEAQSNLGCLMFEREEIGPALLSFEKANNFKPELRINQLRLKVARSSIDPENTVGGRRVITVANGSRLNSGYVILKRPVERELITQVYQMDSRELDCTKDARFGKGKCSTDFIIFEDTNRIVKKVSKDLAEIVRNAVQSDVYIYDSFFNILKKDGGTSPHHHVKAIDKQMGLSKQKYSLVYYLSVGDQNCSEPGFLKLYAPDENILPYDGMIVVMPADRKHSAVYSGGKDRIMIGVNFYSLEF